jgi:site-specific DNA recombinase
MLNVLLSFAQFEREVTGERIRDKIAAAKRKGMWMGGVPPLGYDVDNRLLIINEAEAAVVRRIFEEMLTIGSPTQIAVNLTAEGITTKAWTTQDGQTRAARASTRSTCTSCCATASTWRAVAQGNWYPGVHPPIIDHGLWGQGACGAGQGRARPVGGNQDPLAHRRLAARPAVRAFGRADVPDLLAQERAQVPLLRVQVGGALRRTGQDLRAPACDEMEAAVVAQIRTVLTSPESIASAVRQFIQRNGAQVDEDTTVMAMHRLNDVWEQLFPAERHRIANLMIERMDLVHRRGAGLKVKWRELGWDALIVEFAPDSIGAELVEVEA